MTQDIHTTIMRPREFATHVEPATDELSQELQMKAYGILMLEGDTRPTGEEAWSRRFFALTFKSVEEVRALRNAIAILEDEMIEGSVPMLPKGTSALESRNAG